jgi:hypothetical protein
MMMMMMMMIIIIIIKAIQTDRTRTASVNGENKN